MIDISEKHLAIVKHILNQYVPNTPVGAFGSRVKGQAKVYSDLDLVILSDEKIPLKQYYQILDAFEESDIPFKIDIVDWSRLDDAFKKRISDHYELI